MALYVDIKKKFGDFELDVKFNSESSDIISLFGLSGSGKSVTLKCIAGIIKPDRGNIVINDTVVFDSERKINLPPQKRRIGYLPQSYALFPSMTVKDNIKTGLINHKKSERETLVCELVDKFGLENVKNLFPHQLSGGQQQRVALARALSTSPKLLLLDEPFSSLDSQIKSQLMYDLIKSLDEFKSDVIFVSHNKDEVYSISDKVCTISNGYCHSIREKADAFSKPLCKTDALLLGCENILDITFRNGNRIVTDSGIEFEITDDIDFTSIAFYSDCVKFCTLGDINIKAKIKLIVEKESHSIFILQISDNKKFITAKLRNNDIDRYIVNDAVNIGLKKEDIFLLK
ncbi:MAG: ATP-binding cassette domain-containing protein [Ruminococcus sp.]|nr:ATP-binding cassette domain-containing protein [Ruminococcus sp.]